MSDNNNNENGVSYDSENNPFVPPVDYSGESVFTSTDWGDMPTDQEINSLGLIPDDSPTMNYLPFLVLAYLFLS